MSTTKPNMPAFTSSHAMCMLWGKAAPKMKPHELKWLSSGIFDHIESEAGSLSMMLMSIGCMMSDDSSGMFDDKHKVSDLLFYVSSQLNSISGLVHIADDASFLERQASEGGKP